MTALPRHRLHPLLGILVALAAVPVLLGPPVPEASAAPDWVRIEGSDRIPAAKKLRYRVACRVPCRVAVTARLTWPARPHLVNRLRGRLRAGESRANVLVLNNVARNVLQANFRRARLRVIVRARNRKTGRKGVVRRTFRFSFQPRRG